MDRGQHMCLSAGRTMPANIKSEGTSTRQVQDAWTETCLPASMGRGRQRHVMAPLPPTGGYTLKLQCVISRAMPLQRSWCCLGGSPRTTVGEMCVQVPVICCVPTVPHHQVLRRAIWAAVWPLSLTPNSLKVLDDMWGNL